MKKIEEQHGKDTPEGQLQARIATLKFVVAADLARAEDSQGRLSDQDLARNMAKLGTGLGTKENQLAAMNEVLKDVKMKRNSMLMLDKLIPTARNRGYFTRKERALFAADELARKYVQEYNRRGATNYESESRMFTIEDIMNPEKFDPADSNLQGANGEIVHRSTDSNTIVFLSRDGKNVVEQFSGDQINKAIDDGKIVTLEVGGTDDVKGMESPFGPDPKPNVAPSGTSGKDLPPVVTPTPPATVTTEVLGTDIGVNNITDLGQADSNGIYIVNGVQYTVVKPNPLTLKKVSP